jgi:CRISPR-associated endonuclease/helicase Cas3
MEHDANEARLRYLPDPDDSGSRLDSLTAMGRDDDEELHPFFRALTRLTERTVTAICLFGRGEEQFLDKPCTRLASLRQSPTMADASEILRRSCSISDRRVVEFIEDIPIPAAWKKSTLLRNCHPVVFDADGCFPAGKWRLRLCPDTGLKVEETALC